MVNILAQLKTIMTPICSDVYTNVRSAGVNGNVDRSADFIVLAIIDDRPSMWGDDTPENDTVTVRVNFFTKAPNKCPATKIRIRKALENAGYIWISSNELFESDTGYTHLVVEAEKAIYHDNDTEE